MELVESRVALEEKGLERLNDEFVKAAERGDCPEAQRLLGLGASINARCLPTGKFNSGAAEVSSVEEKRNRDGELELRVSLVGADGAWYSGDSVPRKELTRTALQAASDGGHHTLAKLLVDAGAEVNAPPSRSYGRTALQAAAEGGHQEIVKMLMEVGAAEVNAAPGYRSGRTALQAASDGGHHTLAKLLVDAGAEVNAAPAKYEGRTALQAAAESGHREIVKPLIDAGAEVNRAQNGTSLLVDLVGRGVCMDILELLLHAPKQDLTLRDRFGFTPLHQALRECDKALRPKDTDTDQGGALQADRIQKLIFKLVEGDPGKTGINIKDHSGKTALETAIEIKSLAIVKQLLLRGADTGVLRTEDLRNLLDSATVSKVSKIGLRTGRGGETHVIAEEREGARLEWPPIKEWKWRLEFDPWINISLGQPDDSTYASFMWPNVTGTEQKSLLRDNADPLILENTIRLKWWLGELSEGSNFYLGAPTRAMITGIGVSEKDKVKGHVKVGVIGYVCFCVFIPNGGVKAAENGSNEEGLQSFKFKNQKVEISWIMAHPSETECEPKYGLYHPKELFLRSLLYLGTARLKYLSIPSHGVEFATLFLDDIHRRWLKLLESAKVHLAEFRDKQLVEGGRNPTVIQCLLEDSQQWNKLRSSLKLHISKSREFWNTFKEHEALFMELAESKDDSARISNFLGGHAENSNIGELEAMVKLSRKIELIEGCMSEIDELKGETKEMIELEFNLVSIYEARKSIEMSEVSNKMAERSLEMAALSIKMTEESNKMTKESNKMSQRSNEMSELSIQMSQDSIKMAKHSNSLSLSMKRLSWITFIFLPLTFVSGLFGMNLDILANNPSWTWYFVIAGPVLALIFVVWIMFKYVPISHWIEKNIGSQLEALLVGDRAEPTTANAEPVNHSGLSTSGEVSPRGSSLRMRLIPTREKKRPDDTKQGTMPAPPKVETSEQVSQGILFKRRQ